MLRDLSALYQVRLLGVPNELARGRSVVWVFFIEVLVWRKMEGGDILFRGFVTVLGGDEACEVWSEFGPKCPQFADGPLGAILEEQMVLACLHFVSA